MNLLSRIGVEPAERPFFVWAGLSLMLVGAGTAALQNTAETLFLKRVGVEALPIAFLIGSLLLAAATILVGRVLGSVDPPGVLPRVLMGLGAILVPIWGLMLFDVPGVVAGLLILVKLLEGIALLVYWVALGNLITGRQAKRLFAPLAAGATLGRLLGSFGSQPASLIAGIEGLVVIAAGLYVLAGLSAMRLRHTGSRVRNPLEEGVTIAPESSVPPRKSRGPSLRRIWRESQLFRYLAIWSFCAGALGPMLYFQFSYAVDLSTTGADGEQRLLALYAQFRGWLNVTILMMQLVVSASLYRRFGLPMSSAVWPLTYLGGFVWMGLALKLPVAMTTVAVARLEGDAVAKPALKILHNLLPERFRANATGLTEGPVKGFGGAFGNALVLLAIGFAGPAIVSIPAIPVAAIWTLVAIVLWRLYPRLLLQASSAGSLSASEGDLARMLDPATIRTLAASLSDPDPDVCRAAAELIAQAEPATAASALTSAIEEASPERRPILIEALQRAIESAMPGELHDSRACSAVARLLGSGEVLPPEERADLVQIYARLTGAGVRGEHDEALDAAIGDSEAAVRLAAMAELDRRGLPPPGLRNLDRALAGAFATGDILVRRTARKELRAGLLSSKPDSEFFARLELLTTGLERRVDRAEVAESLVEVARRHGDVVARLEPQMMRWRHDPDPRVRAAILGFLGHIGTTRHRSELLEALASRDELEGYAAKEGLAALGPVMTGPLLQTFRSDDLILRDRVIDTLCRLRVDPMLLSEIYARELRAAREVAIQLSVLSRSAASGDHMVLCLLTERFDEHLAAALAVLASIEGSERIADLEQRMREEDDLHRRSILAEALDSVLAPEDRDQLVPLFEANDPLDRGQVASRQLGVTLPEREEVWAALSEDADPLLVRLVEALPAPWLESEVAIADTRAMPLQTMQIAALLQKQPGFDRLVMRQLVGAAEAAEELRFEAGDTIYSQGDEKPALFVLVDGEVSTSSEESGLGRLVSGALLGEISSLDGGTRTETARAETVVVALRLEREPLIALMNEAPGLAIGLGQHLAARLRSLRADLAAAETVDDAGAQGESS